MHGAYLVHDVLQRVGAVNSKAHKDEVGLGVGQWPQPVVLLLAGRIPECQLDRLAGRRVCRVGDVVLENGWDVFLEGLACMFKSIFSVRADLPLGSSPGCS